MLTILKAEIKIYYTIINSPVCKLYAAKTAKGIGYLSFSRKGWDGYLNDLKRDDKIELYRNDVEFFPLKKALKRYFSREKMNFSFPFDILWGTPFQRKVWKAMRKIPYGQTRSYKWLAQQVGHPKKARAVGQACGSNPIPILNPCHRVIKENGELGGFSSGLRIKRKLLRLESNA